MLNRPLGSIYFTAFDFETTGLYPDKDRIIEIGAVKFNLKGEEFRFSGLINPKISIPQGASAVNGIFDNMVSEMPLIEDILPGFLSFIDDTVLIAHNIGFDASFLCRSIERLDMDVPNLFCLDTILLAKKYFKGLYSYSLGNIAKSIGIDIENAHRAEDDAAACMQFFLACIKNIPDYNYLELKGLLKHAGLRSRSLAKNYAVGR